MNKNEIIKIENLIKTDEFIELFKKLKQEKHKIILLGLGGSYAYGLNGENSDVDLRGILRPPINNLLGFGEFEQYVDEETDTVLYDFNKMIKLLCSCNPNTIEILGLKEGHYIIKHEVGQDLLRNKTMFLSQRALNSFKGYSLAQLHRLENALCRDVYTPEQRLKHLKNALERATMSFERRYAHFTKDNTIKIEVKDNDLVLNCDFNNYPIGELSGILGELKEVYRSYDKLNTRNNKKDNEHLNKHICHIFRLLFMYIDIASKMEIITYREKEHDFLINVKNGLFINEDGTLRKEFYEAYSQLEKEVEYVTKHTVLPENPNLEKIEEFLVESNKRTINR